MAGTGVGKFSSTAGSNTANMTVNFAENMAPSNVNNAARELMGHMRDMYEQLGDGYFEFGDGDGTYTVARGDADTITLTSAADLSGVYFPGRKIRITDGGANVVEGTIASSSHASTTQTVNLTGISLASGTPTKVELGIDTAAFGGRVILDDDSDTYIEAPTDDTIDFYAGGTKIGTFTATTVGFNDGVTITTADNSDTLTLTSTDADADVGPVLNLYRNSSSPADNDDAGRIHFTGNDSGGNATTYATIRTVITDVTDGTEDVQVLHQQLIGGTEVNTIRIKPDEIVFNDSSIDLDFRVESNGNANMLFVDGGADCVNIGGSSDRGGLLNVEGNGGVVIRVDDNNTALKLQSTDTDANAGPLLTLERSNNSAANDDTLGQIQFKAQNAANEGIEYANIKALIANATDGAEAGQLFIDLMKDGTSRRMLTMTGTATVFNEDSVDRDFRVESNGNANMLFVDGGNNLVGIGADPDLGAGLHIKIADSGASSVDSNSDELVIENSASSGMTILSGTSSEGSIKFGDSTDNDAGRIIYDHSADKLFFMTSGNTVGEFRNNGDFYTNDGTVHSLSDARVKTDIKDLTDGLEIVKQLKPRTFKYNSKSTFYNENDADKIKYGFVADEVKEVASQYTSIVSGKVDGEIVEDYKSVSATKMIPMLVKAIQELEARVVALES